ncbi:TetR/AcrR family transcriptional regulator [Gracilibacillus xinjiangensis]|uniref:TetR/AcrR family transcriptional regulator n=1 Tax=Gracilibacillus xinjiangensis TaxID=1193282 RepID=A0ABV8WXL3_9BACI
MSTKDQIRLKSQELFAEMGYEATSLSKIAEKVGIKKASIYSHYENKEAIFLDVIRVMAEEYVSNIKNTFNEEEDDIEQQLKHAFFRYIENWSDEEDVTNQLYNRLILFPPAGLKDKLGIYIEESERIVNEIVTAVIVKGQELGDIHADFEASKITSSFFSLIVGIISESSYNKTYDLEEQAKCSWNIFWRGIAAD